MTTIYIINDQDECCYVGPFNSKKEATNYAKKYLIIEFCDFEKLKDPKKYSLVNKKFREEQRSHYEALRRMEERFKNATDKI